MAARAVACSTASTPERRRWSRCCRRTPTRYTWVAAAVGSNNAAGYQLATGEPVMAIGGFNGTDPSPTLAQFQQYVADGQDPLLHRRRRRRRQPTGGSDAVAGDRRLGRGRTSPPPTVGGATVYDLTG